MSYFNNFSFLYQLYFQNDNLFFVFGSTKSIEVNNLLIKVENLSIQFKINWFYDQFNGTSIIDSSDGDNLGDKNIFLWFYLDRLHRPRLNQSELTTINFFVISSGIKLQTRGIGCRLSHLSGSMELIERLTPPLHSVSH